MRKFFKISADEFIKSNLGSESDYNDFSLPSRSTKFSAGYDFKLLSDVLLKPGDKVTIPTGIKVSMEKDEVLMIFIRSSLGFKYNIRLCNQVGIIDSDYFNNSDNEGHIFIKIENAGADTVSFKKGDRFAQGIFVKFLTTDEDCATTVRNGGIGSTDKELQWWMVSVYWYLI